MNFFFLIQWLYLYIWLYLLKKLVKSLSPLETGVRQCVYSIERVSLTGSWLEKETGAINLHAVWLYAYGN